MEQFAYVTRLVAGAAWGILPVFLLSASRDFVEVCARRTVARHAILGLKRRVMPLTVEEVHESFDAELRSFVAAKVRDPASAEDLVQEVYFKVQTRIETIRDEERVDAWVYRVARNTIYDDFYKTFRPTQELKKLPSPSPVAPNKRWSGGSPRP